MPDHRNSNAPEFQQNSRYRVQPGTSIILPLLVIDADSIYNRRTFNFDLLFG